MLRSMLFVGMVGCANVQLSDLCGRNAATAARLLGCGAVRRATGVSAGSVPLCEVRMCVSLLEQEVATLRGRAARMHASEGVQRELAADALRDIDMEFVMELGALTGRRKAIAALMVLSAGERVID